MSLKISEMTSVEGDYLNNPSLYKKTTYDPDTGGVVLAAPLVSVYEFNHSNGGNPPEYGWIGAPEARPDSAIPMVNLNADGSISSNDKASLIGLLSLLFSNRRRFYKTNFDVLDSSSNLLNDGFHISDNQNLDIPDPDSSIAVSKIATDRAWFDFGRVTVGKISNIYESPQVLADGMNRRFLADWGDKIRFGVSGAANLYFDGDAICNNLKLNIGFGSFYQSIGSDGMQSTDTADTFGMCINIKFGHFYIDWKYGLNHGSYNTGIRFDNGAAKAGGDFAVVMDIDTAVGMKLIIASPTGFTYTLNFPLLDPKDNNLGLDYDTLFGDADGVAELPHHDNDDGIANLDDDYYGVCAILAKFLARDIVQYAGDVAFGVSRLQYPTNTDDAGLKFQSVATGYDWRWGGYDPKTFQHNLELKAMYFESEITDTDPTYRYGNTFNLATLGRAELNPLDQHVADGGNQPLA